MNGVVVVLLTTVTNALVTVAVQPITYWLYCVEVKVTTSDIFVTVDSKGEAVSVVLVRVVAIVLVFR